MVRSRLVLGEMLANAARRSTLLTRPGESSDARACRVVGRIWRERPHGASGSIRVRVAAGTDPVTKQRHRLTEIIPAGLPAEDEAERATRRLLVQVDEKVNPRTAATVAPLLEKHLMPLEVERTTLATFENLARPSSSRSSRRCRRVPSVRRCSGRAAARWGCSAR